MMPNCCSRAWKSVTCGYRWPIIYQSRCQLYIKGIIRSIYSSDTYQVPVEHALTVYNWRCEPVVQDGNGPREVPLDAPLEQDVPADDLLQHECAEGRSAAQLDVLQGRVARPVRAPDGGVHRRERRVARLPPVVLGQRPSVGALLERAQLQPTPAGARRIRR